MPYIEGDQLRRGAGFAPITGADRSLRVELQAPKPITVSGNAPTTVDFAALVPVGEYRNGAHVNVEYDDFVVRGVLDGSGWSEDGRVASVGSVKSVADSATAVVANIPALLVYPAADGKAANTSAYHVGATNGAAVYVYDASAARTTHNGATVIAPNATFPSDLTDATQIQTWHSGTGLTGNGVWRMQVRESRISAASIGFVDDPSYDVLASAIDQSYRLSAMFASDVLRVEFDGERIANKTYRNFSTIVTRNKDISIEGKIRIYLHRGFYVENGSKQSTTLSTTSLRRSKTLDVVSAGTIEKGDVVFITSTEDGDTGWGYKKSDITTVRSVLSNDLTLDNFLEFDYTSASSTLTTARPVNVTIQDIEIKSDDTPGEPFNFTLFNNVTVQRLSSEAKEAESPTVGLSIIKCANSFVGNYTCRNAYYPLLFSTCRSVLVDGFTGVNVRHAITASTFCNGVAYKNGTGDACYGLVDHHMSFRVSYENIQSTNEISGSNCRAIGVDIKRCRFHSLSAQQFAINTALLTAFTSGADVFSEPEYSLRINDLVLDSPETTVNIYRLSKSTILENVTTGILADTSPYLGSSVVLRNIRVGALKLRSSGMDIDGITFDPSLVSSKDLALSIGSLGELKPMRNMTCLVGYDYFIGGVIGTSNNDRQKIIGGIFKGIKYAMNTDYYSGLGTKIEYSGCEFNAVGSSLAARANSTAYSVDDYIVVNSHYYKCTVAGTSAASIPTYTITADSEVVDGTCTFIHMGLRSWGESGGKDNTFSSDCTFINGTYSPRPSSSGRVRETSASSRTTQVAATFDPGNTSYVGYDKLILASGFYANKCTIETIGFTFHVKNVTAAPMIVTGHGLMVYTGPTSIPPGAVFTVKPTGEFAVEILIVGSQAKESTVAVDLSAADATSDTAVSLPASPVVGQVSKYFDSTRSATGTRRAAFTDKIKGQAATTVYIDSVGASIAFEYTGTVYGWDYRVNA